MKTFLLISMFSFSALCASAQSMLEVNSLGTKYTEEQIVSAFEGGDFCPYFYKTQRNQLTLDDGSIIELLSVEEQGLSLSECGMEDGFTFKEATWSISDSGIVMRKQIATLTKKAE